MFIEFRCVQSCVVVVVVKDTKMGFRLTPKRGCLTLLSRQPHSSQSWNLQIVVQFEGQEKE